MKKLLALIFLIPAVAFADPTDSMEGANVHIKGTATVSICAEDALRIATNCDSGTTYVYTYDNAGGIISSSGFSWYADGDANRKLAFDASSDTALTLTYGDGSSASTLTIAGATAASHLVLNSGSDAAADVDINGTDDVLIDGGDDVIITGTDDVVIQGQGSGDIITFAGGGTNIDLTIADDLVSTPAGTKVSFGDGAGFEIPNTNSLPATCNIGEIFHDPNSDDCADTGAGDGALCICKSANTWVLISNF